MRRLLTKKSFGRLASLRATRSFGFRRTRTQAITQADPLYQELTPEQLEEYGAAFDAADVLGDKRLPFKKLMDVLETVDMPLDEEEIECHLMAIGLYDADDRCISRDGFIRLMAHRKRELEIEGIDICVDPTEAPTTLAARSLPASSVESEKPKLSIFARCAFYLILFLAHWFGSHQFDFDGDGDFDEEDVLAFMENKSTFVKRTFKRGGKRTPQNSTPKSDAGAASPKTPSGSEMPRARALSEFKNLATGQQRAAKEAQRLFASLTLENLAGNWVVGEPGEDFVCTVKPCGVGAGGKLHAECMYDGVYVGPGSDITQEGSGTGRTISRHDGGWFLDLRRSSLLVLVWSSGSQELEWRRMAHEDELSLSSLKGEWCVIENGEETATTIEVRESGHATCGGEREPELDLRVSGPTSENSYPEISRGGGWVVDALRSNTQVLVWANPAEQGVFVMWRRPKTAAPNVESIKSLFGRAGGSVDGGLNWFEDFLDNSNVDGSEFEDKEKQAIEDMFTKDVMWPKFVVIQAIACFSLWIIFAFFGNYPADISVPRRKAGMDNVWPGLTDLRLNETNCTSLRFQIWRWFSYQFTHVGLNHVLLNCLMTLILGIPLEALCGAFKLFLMFNNGVLGGALAYGVFDGRNTVVGMSGGCYALIGIHFAQILMNWRKMKFRGLKIGLLCSLVFIETLNYHFGGVKDQEDLRMSASNAAHLGGFIAGALIGCSLAYDQKVTRVDILIKAATFSFGLVIYAFCIVWLLRNEEPFPIYDWFGEREHMYQYAQVYHRRCLGQHWRCVRCLCKDTECVVTLSGLPDYNAHAATVGGWWRAAVSHLQCSAPWYGFEEGLARDVTENTTSQMDSSPSPCTTRATRVA